MDLRLFIRLAVLNTTCGPSNATVVTKLPRNQMWLDTFAYIVDLTLHFSANIQTIVRIAWNSF